MTKQATALPSAPPNVQNGTYTVDHGARGHFTIKLHTAQGGNLRGKRILSLLTGPDNTSDYKGVAFWNDQRREAFVWKRYLGAEKVPIDGRHWSKGSDPEGYRLDAPGLSSVQQKLIIWADLVNRGERGFWHGEGYRLLHSGRCVTCNRELTDPESIRLGIGPVCGGRS